MPAFDKLRIVHGRLLYVFDEPSSDPQAELHVRNQRKNVGIAIQRRFDVTGASAAGQAAMLIILDRSVMTAVSGLSETGAVSADSSLLIPSAAVAAQAATVSIQISGTDASMLIPSALVTGHAATLSIEASDASYDRLLEDGSSWLLESGDHWEIEHLEYKLLEDGSAWLLETGDRWLTEHGISYLGPFLLMENGAYWLFQDGISRWKLENG